MTEETPFLRLVDMIGDWREHHPSDAAFIVAHETLHYAMLHPDWCLAVVCGQEGGAVVGAGIDIDTMLDYGLLMFNVTAPVTIKEKTP